MNWAQRLLARVRGAVAPAQRTYFAGATGGRLVADWIFAPMVSANNELKVDLTRLRARCRELERNEPLAARYLALMADNVIGSQGIRCEPRVWDRQGNLDKVRTAQVAAQWLAWTARGSCMRDGRLSFTDALRLAVRTRARDGECFIRMVPTKDNPDGLALEFWDADLMNQIQDRQSSREANAIILGVEQDAAGRPVSYHVVSDYDRREPLTIDAGWMLHYYRLLRPHQVRGYPDFAPVMFSMRMLNGYREAELVAARTAAAKMGFLVTKDDGLGIGGEDPRVAVPLEAEAGVISQLPHNTEFQQWDPQHPTQAFGDFCASIATSIATGLNHSYPTLTGDMKGTSWSSGRLGVTGERDHYRAEQGLVIESICRPVFARWSQLALLRGTITLPPGATLDALWMPRGFPYVDPLKDMEANREALATFQTSYSQLAAEQGLDFEDLLIANRRDEQLAAVYGFTLVREVKTNVGVNTQVSEAVSAAVDAAAANGAARARIAA